MSGAVALLGSGNTAGTTSALMELTSWWGGRSGNNKHNKQVSGITYQKVLVQFSHSVLSDSLQPHGLQHARLPCPSPTPRAYSNSCPLSQ